MTAPAVTARGRLQGKVAIVTGAGSRGPGLGNGKATAILFAREGAYEARWVTGQTLVIDAGLTATTR